MGFRVELQSYKSKKEKRSHELEARPMLLYV